ncbi:MAG: outer membrane protein assembly factor BamB family protein [Treponema sp.]
MRSKLMGACMFFFFFACLLYAQTEQTEALCPLWKVVLAGETKCSPIFYQGYIYTFSDDQAISCIDTAGSFVWRHTVKKVHAPLLSISPAGFLLLTDFSGIVQAFSMQGACLWTVNIEEPLLYEPYAAQDGRIYLISETAIVCVSMKGTVRWRATLPAPPVRQACEIGTAAIVLELADKTLLTVSHTGTLLQQTPLREPLAAITGTPDGCLTSATDGTFTYTLAAPHSATVWQTQETPPLALHHTAHTVLCLYADGTLSLRDIRHNTVLWTAQLAAPLSQPLTCQKYGNTYALITEGFAAAVTDTGLILWQQRIASQPFLPLITADGILITMQDWVLTGFRIPEMPVALSQTDDESLYNSIELQNKTSEQAFSFYFQYNNADKFLAHVQNSIDTHAIQDCEATYAVLLSSIVQNNKQAAYFPYCFNMHQRAVAAALLGKLESLEYRALLIAEAQKASNAVIGIGIIRGLGNSACDPDGNSVRAIQLLLQRYGTGLPAVGWAACDALAEIVRYGACEASRQAVKTLLSISAGSFTENIRKYARQKLKFIIQ